MIRPTEPSVGVTPILLSVFVLQEERFGRSVGVRRLGVFDEDVRKDVGRLVAAVGGIVEVAVDFA